MNETKTYWLDSKENVNKVYWAVWIVCGVLLLIDPLISRHEEFGFAEWFGFFGFFGFVACFGLVLAAKVLRRVISRAEDYYER